MTPLNQLTEPKKIISYAQIMIFVILSKYTLESREKKIGLVYL